MKGIKGYARKALLFCMILLFITATWNFIACSALATILTNLQFIKTPRAGLEQQMIAALPWLSQGSVTTNVSVSAGITNNSNVTPGLVKHLASAE